MTDGTPTTGPEAIYAALQGIDLDQLEQEQRAIIKSGAKTKRGRAVKLLNSIAGMRTNKLKPSDMMINSVPVIPPKFRPFSITGDTFLPGDSNEVYRDVIEYRRLYNDTEGALGRDGASESYMDMYRAVKAAYGYGESPNPKTRARDVKGFFKMVTGVNPKTCYDEETEILTCRGWVLFKDLLPDDQVGSIDPATNGFLWSPYDNYVDAPYDGMMVKFDRRRQSLLVTPNHRMWIKKRRGNENISTESMLQNWEVVDAARLVYTSTRTWTQTAAASYTGGAFSLPTKHAINPEDWASLVGWYASEGNAHGEAAVVVWQSDRNMPYRDELEALFDRLKQAGLKISKCEKRQGTEEDPSVCWGWSIPSSDVSQWLINNVGHSSHEKKLSAEIRNWPGSLLEEVMKSYLRGDGSKRKDGVEIPIQHCARKFRDSISDEHGRMSTVSYQLFSDLQEVAFKLGLTLVRHSSNSSQAGRYVASTREIYRCGLIGRWNFTSDNQAAGEWEHYKGRIYCVQVPTGLLVVRRADKVCVSGNSFYQQKLVSKPVDTVGRGVVIPDADLGLDEIGIPEEMAWKLFGSHVQRRLVRGGLPAPAALRYITDRSDVALKALKAEITERPVVATRSPAWHRTNVIGQYARLVPGDAIRVNTYITDGMNMDFNGDDQIGKILVLARIGSVAESRLLRLQCDFNEATVAAMEQKQIIPLLNKLTHRLFLCDLEDCPRGEKIGENPRGKNGHIDLYKAPDGMMALAFDELTGQACWADVFGVSVHPDREVEVVQLSNGRQIITDDDPRAVYGMDPSTSRMVRDTPTNALQRGLAVPCARDLAPACIGLGAVSEWQVGGESIPLDFDFGYLMGALCGDGWWDKENLRWRNIYLSDLRGFVAAKVGAVLRGLFGPVGYSAQEFKASEIEGRYGDSVRHTFSSKDGNLRAFAEFCSVWMGGHGDEKTSGSGNKKLPDMFLLAPEPFRRGLLTGMFDTDGTCSISDAKGSPQLMCSITTTSARLAADTKFLCLTLGVHASVSFSKLTIKGNKSWICSVSTVGLRESGDVLRDLQTPYKRENFMNTPVSGQNTSLVHNKAVVPHQVFDIVQTDLINPKITKADRADHGPDLEWKKHQQNMAIQWSKGKLAGIISRPSAKKVIEHIGELHTRRCKARDAALVLLRSGSVEMTPTNVQILRDGIYATAAPFSVHSDRGSEAFKLASIVKAAAHAGGVLGNRRLNNLLSRLEALPVYRGALDSDILKGWQQDILSHDHITWATVEDVQYTGIKETGYDLTVPGYETFMSADGVILSNTSSIHVPVSKAAVKDVREKMMASKMLWSIKDRDKTMGTPKHEQIIGLDMGNRPGGKNFKFATDAEAMSAIERGEVDLNDDIDITG